MQLAMEPDKYRYINIDACVVVVHKTGAQLATLAT